MGRQRDELLIGPLVASREMPRGMPAAPWAIPGTRAMVAFGSSGELPVWAERFEHPPRRDARLASRVAYARARRDRFSGSISTNTIMVIWNTSIIAVIAACCWAYKASTATPRAERCQTQRGEECARPWSHGGETNCPKAQRRRDDGRRPRLPNRDRKRAEYQAPSLYYASKVNDSDETEDRRRNNKICLDSAL